MNLFFSGIGKGIIETDERLGSPRYRLFSCHGAYLKYAKKTTPLLSHIDSEFEVLYDSGAFTAWTQGEEVDLVQLGDTYEGLLDDYGHTGRGTYFINLDKIPGEPGRTAGEAEIEEALKISDENFHYLRERVGDRVIPVFHQNESKERLKEIAGLAPYICISPRNDLAEKFRVGWAAEVHRHWFDELGIEGVRTHGLATTGHPMMTTVPWHSVDSATWIMIAAYGHVYINHRLQFCSVSSDSPNQKVLGKHYRNLSPTELEVFHQMMMQFDFTLEELENDFVQRATWNRIVMSQLQRSIKLDEVMRKPAAIPLFDL